MQGVRHDSRGGRKNNTYTSLSRAGIRYARVLAVGQPFVVKGVAEKKQHHKYEAHFRPKCHNIVGAEPRQVRSLNSLLLSCILQYMHRKIASHEMSRRKIMTRLVPGWSDAEMQAHRSVFLSSVRALAEH